MPGFVHGTSRFFTFPAAAASATIEKEPSPAGTPDSSQRCTLFACRFATGDDMVAIKSGKNPEATASAAHAAMARTLTEALRPLLPPNPGEVTWGNIA